MNKGLEEKKRDKVGEEVDPKWQRRSRRENRGMKDIKVNAKLVHWDDPKGWDGEEVGQGFRTTGHMYTCGCFMSMNGKNHHNIVK